MTEFVVIVVWNINKINIGKITKYASKIQVIYTKVKTTKKNVKHNFLSPPTTGTKDYYSYFSF